MATKMITLTARASLNEVFSACGELVLICIDFLASCRQTPGDSPRGTAECQDSAIRLCLH